MFKFKLENVLNFRKIKEEEAVREYRLKKREINECEVKIGEIKKKITENKKELQTVLDVNMIKIIDNYLFRLGKELEYTELKLHNLKNELVALENKMFQAMKERKVLENLKEKKRLEYFREENLKEQKFLDEIASIAENRKKLN
jgi:flagellar FliJ protein